MLFSESQNLPKVLLPSTPPSTRFLVFNGDTQKRHLSSDIIAGLTDVSQMQRQVDDMLVTVACCYAFTVA